MRRALNFLHIQNVNTPLPQILDCDLYAITGTPDGLDQCRLCHGDPRCVAHQAGFIPSRCLATFTMLSPSLYRHITHTLDITTKLLFLVNLRMLSTKPDPSLPAH